MNLLNSNFVAHANSEEGRQKLAEHGSGLIRDRLRELSFARGIIPPLPITPAECQISTEHDGLVKIEHLEPESKAMVVDFRGASRARYVSAPRVAVSFFTIESEHYQKTEQELLSYPIPITKMIEDFTATDLQDVEDRQFLIYAEAGVQLMQEDANVKAGKPHDGFNITNINAGNVAADLSFKPSVTKGAGVIQAAAGGAVANWTIYPVAKSDFVRLRQMLAMRKLRLEVVLMNDVDFQDILQFTLEDLGDKLTSEIVVDGYKYSTLLGNRFVRTIKNEILRRGNIYAFTAPEFLGVFYILNNTKFFVKKEWNKIEWGAWEDIGMSLINLNSLVKLELYAGSVTPGHLDLAADPNGMEYTSKLVADEEDLGQKNNKAEDGFVSPLVRQF
jgi:hypothetical protein